MERMEWAEWAAGTVYGVDRERSELMVWTENRPRDVAE